MIIWRTIITLSFCWLLVPGLLSAQEAASTYNPAEALQQNKALQTAELSLVKKVLSFDTVRKGDIVRQHFYLKNTGTEPLLIYEIHGGCECVWIEWDKEAIAPNATSKITVLYDTAHPKERVDFKRKVFVVFSNARNPEEKLVLEGRVIH
ncbi:DUF1573 domain-containing protein [Eisenibacter elegans]|uniref:DUF1573 domain-containing protein n=1 Tax=Eisenibacter elegans TaxID=997 RepID=UPI00042448FC|nr:DUF1573 domain-containing protein [Eisenibacter elegans]